jgi:hypothetical protein
MRNIHHQDNLAIHGKTGYFVRCPSVKLRYHMTMIEGELDGLAETRNVGGAVPSRSWRRDLLYLAILAAISALIGAYHIATTVLISRDGVFYIDQAQRVGHDFSSVAKQYPPIYPLMLSGAHEFSRLFTADNSSRTWAFSSQTATLLSRMLTLAVLFAIGKRLVGSGRSFLAVMILCILPYGAKDGSDVLREWPLLLVVATGLWLLLKAAEERKWQLFAVAGLVAGMGYSLHPASTQLAVYAGLVVLCSLPSIGARFRSIAAFLAGAVVVIVPVVATTGAILPQNMQSESLRRPAAILSVGGKPANPDLIEALALESQNVEMEIKVADANVLDSALSAVLIPAHSRPVYTFHRRINGACFLTALEREKDALLTDRAQKTWTYDGILCYAYPQPKNAPNLCPVYRLWSESKNRHFFTTDKSQRDAMLAGSEDGRWASEDIAFYVPLAQKRPPQAVPVHLIRHGKERCLWSAGSLSQESFGSDQVQDEIAWYAFKEGPLPAGAALAGRTFRWCPDPNQVGRYRFNLIVRHQETDSCQIVEIDVRRKSEAGKVQAAQAPNTRTPPPVTAPSATKTQPVLANQADVARRSAAALGYILRGVVDNLMVFFVLPLILGCIYRWRYGATGPEKMLMAAVLIVNGMLMFGRYVWVLPDSSRRYGLPMVALTIFYVPAGLELIAQWLANFCRRGKTKMSCRLSKRFWVYTLTILGVAICLPKLLQPLGAGKEDYRTLAQWLRDNTPVDARIAVPDRRIAFYADRDGFSYDGQPISWEVNYIVANSSEDSRALADRWSPVYSQPRQKSSRGQFVVYTRPTPPVAGSSRRSDR